MNKPSDEWPHNSKLIKKQTIMKIYYRQVARLIRDTAVGVADQRSTILYVYIKPIVPHHQGYFYVIHFIYYNTLVCELITLRLMDID